MLRPAPITARDPNPCSSPPQAEQLAEPSWLGLQQQELRPACQQQGRISLQIPCRTLAQHSQHSFV
jgi:hypothetical protein